VHTGLNPPEGLTIRNRLAYSVSLFQWVAEMMRNPGWLTPKRSALLAAGRDVSNKIHDRGILAEFRWRDMQIISTAAPLSQREDHPDRRPFVFP
jgi:hypothetical protein